VLRGFAPPPHTAPLSKAQFSLNIHLFILIIDLESISKKILKYASLGVNHTPIKENPMSPLKLCKPWKIGIKNVQTIKQL
jgi:hypothetical protein